MHTFEVCVVHVRDREETYESADRQRPLQRTRQCCIEREREHVHLRHIPRMMASVECIVVSLIDFNILIDFVATIACNMYIHIGFLNSAHDNH